MPCCTLGCGVLAPVPHFDEAMWYGDGNCNVLGDYRHHMDHKSEVRQASHGWQSKYLAPHFDEAMW
jgi:hypothetical protein